MRNILAITMALMIVAVLIMPTMGYTIQTPGNQSYTLKSSPRINYTISTGTPAHNLTQAMAAAGRISIPPAITVTKKQPTPAVTTKRVAPSIHVSTKRTQYTVPQVTEQVGQPAALEKVGQPAAVEQVGQQIKAIVEQPPTPKGAVTENITLPAAVKDVNVGLPAAVEQAGQQIKAIVEQPPTPKGSIMKTAEETRFEIKGIVFDDQNGNGVKDPLEPGLAGWIVDLKKPDNTTINTSTKDDGSYDFIDLNPGEYVVSEIVQPGWNLIAPADNMIKISLTENSQYKFDQNIANKMVTASTPAPAPTPGAIAAEVAESEANATFPENVNATSPTFPENVNAPSPGAH